MTCIRISNLNFEKYEKMRTYVKKYNETTNKTVLFSALDSSRIVLFSEDAPDDFFTGFEIEFNIDLANVVNINAEVTWSIAAGESAICTLGDVMRNALKYERIKFYRDYETANTEFSRLNKMNNFNAFALIKTIKAFCIPGYPDEAYLISENLYNCVIKK